MEKKIDEQMMGTKLEKLSRSSDSNSSLVLNISMICGVIILKYAKYLNKVSLHLLL